MNRNDQEESADGPRKCGVPVGRRRLRVAVCLMALLLILHQPLLTLLAQLLIVDQPESSADYVLVIGGDRRFDVAAEMVRQQQVAGVLLIEDRHTTLVEAGVDLRLDLIKHRELVRRGVSKGDITMISGEAWNDWEIADRLKDFLADHDARVIALEEQFDSRCLRFIFDRVLGDASSQVSVKSLADRTCGDHNWWRSRGGLKYVFSSFVELGHAVLCGRPSPYDENRWTVDSLQRWFGRTEGDSPIFLRKKGTVPATPQSWFGREYRSQSVAVQ